MSHGSSCSDLDSTLLREAFSTAVSTEHVPHVRLSADYIEVLDVFKSTDVLTGPWLRRPCEYDGSVVWNADEAVCGFCGLSYQMAIRGGPVSQGQVCGFWPTMPGTVTADWKSGVHLVVPGMTSDLITCNWSILSKRTSAHCCLNTIWKVLEGSADRLELFARRQNDKLK